MNKFCLWLIRKFWFVRKYEGEGKTWETISKDSRAHIRWSVLQAIFLPLLMLINPFFIGLHVLMFHITCPWIEDMQFYKEKNKPFWNVTAQKFEKGVGFVVLLPWAIGMFLFSYFKWSLL